MASQSLCSRLLLPGRDALPPPELDTGAQDGFGGLPPGVRETDVQALRTSLGCDREEAVTLLRCAHVCCCCCCWGWCERVAVESVPAC